MDLLIIVFLVVVLAIILHLLISRPQHQITPPKLTNNPSQDVITTETAPLLSFFNALGGHNRQYEIELDTSPNFETPDKSRYIIPENGKLITNFKIPPTKALRDKSQYFWRGRTICGSGLKSDWAKSRFFVDTKSDDSFMNLVRAEIKKIEVSGGYNAKNIIDYDDPGLITFWQSPPPGDETQWVKFDLGKPTEISRAWILSNQTNSDGWLKNFYFEKSADGKNWQKIPGSEISNNNTFRNIVDFEKSKSRYFRLVILDFIGYAAQINEVILYSPDRPAPPKVPQEDYVLVIGNEHNGFTFTDLCQKIESLGFNLKTVSVPYFQVSMAMIQLLPHKPVAIVLSGNNADYPNLPMFEHNGEFEIIRQSDIPILGICAGHQFLAMAYGYTRARSMGWSDISAMEPVRKMTKIKILKNDPIFEGINDEFTAPEIHSWAVVEPGEEFEIIAASSYVQVQKSKKRLIYGIQFHAEINESYNQSQKILKNFLRLALKKDL